MKAVLLEAIIIDRTQKVEKEQWDREAGSRASSWDEEPCWEDS